MEIKRLQAGDSTAADRWDAFVMGCAQATFFHRAGWQRVLRGVFRHETHYLYAESDGQIRGVLPLVHVNSLMFGRALVMVGLAEGIAIYGLIVSILILNRLG